MKRAHRPDITMFWTLPILIENSSQSLPARVNCKHADSIKASHRNTAFIRLVLVALVFMLFFCSSQVATAQDLKSQVQSLKALLKEKDLLSSSSDHPVTKFLAYLDKLIELKSDLTAFDASISASGCFDTARYNSGAVDVQANIERDSYPHSLRFKAASKFLFSPTTVQNELTSTLINYDHYLSKHVEVYGFIERFSDSFMSIKQRYESGLGFKMEFDIEPHGGSDQKSRHPDASSLDTIDNQIGSSKEVRTLEEYRKLRDEFLACILTSQLKEDDRDKIIEDIRVVDREHEHLGIARLKKRSPFSWGVAFSLLSEVEQAEIKTGTLDPGTQKEIIVPIDPSQFFRLTIRPSFNWRLSDVASLSTLLYWKASLRKAGLFFKDSRLDIYSEMKFKVAKDFLWGGPASVSIDYQFHYDWMPPAIPDEQIRDYVTRNIVLRFVSAGNFHHYVAVRFSIAF